MGTPSDKHSNNNNNTNHSMGNSPLLLHSSDIKTNWDMRMITYVIYSVRSTQPPLMITYPNTNPQFTYLWN